MNTKLKLFTQLFTLVKSNLNLKILNLLKEENPKSIELKTKFLNLIALTCLLCTLSCGFQFNSVFQNESGTETVTELKPKPSDGKPSSPDLRRFTLNQKQNIRFNQGNILEFKVELPQGTEITIPKDYQINQAKYRKSNGDVEWSSTGFISGVQIAKVTTEDSAQFPQDKIDQINNTPDGLFITAAIVGSIEGIDGEYAAISIADTQPGPGFQKFFADDGQPKFNFSNLIRKRWGNHVNLVIESTSQSTAEQLKWQRIYQELKLAADRSVATSKHYLMIDSSEAVKQTDAFENSGIVPTSGAWSMAVQVTAPRHGFANVPCAEFMSEMVREAYSRAGYSVTDDFNSSRDNLLFWKTSAAVVNFSNFLYRAGWIPWDMSQFRPPVGALMMNEHGNTPGHAYISAGADGRLIMDNGSPQGRDLRKTVEKTINIMYKTGVFFLPPGIIPAAW